MIMFVGPAWPEYEGRVQKTEDAHYSPLDNSVFPSLVPLITEAFIIFPSGPLPASYRLLKCHERIEAISWECPHLSNSKFSCFFSLPVLFSPHSTTASRSSWLRMCPSSCQRSGIPHCHTFLSFPVSLSVISSSSESSNSPPLQSHYPEHQIHADNSMLTKLPLTPVFDSSLTSLLSLL